MHLFFIGHPCDLTPVKRRYPVTSITASSYLGLRAQWVNVSLEIDHCSGTGFRLDRRLNPGVITVRSLSFRLGSVCMHYHFLLRRSRNCRIVYSPNVVLYCALKPCLVTEKSVVNLIISTEVLSPLTVTVSPDLEPLSLSILRPKMSVNSTKSQL